MKSDQISQIFDELAGEIPPARRENFQRLGRRLAKVDPDDEILLLVWYVAIWSQLEINQGKRLEKRIELLEAQSKQTEKWSRLLFGLFLGLSLLLGIFVCLFEFIMKSLPLPLF